LTNRAQQLVDLKACFTHSRLQRQAIVLSLALPPAEVRAAGYGTSLPVAYTWAGHDVTVTTLLRRR
jgi:hypothetical protein